MKNVKTELELDGNKIHRDTIFIEIGNTRYTGSKFVISPNAVIDDGYLDVVIINKCSRLRVLKLLPTIFSGNHIYKKEVEVIKAKKILISTVPEQPLIPDGELFGSTPLSIEVLPKHIPFFWHY